MFELANRRLVRASVVCGAITMLLMALPVALGGNIVLAAVFVIMIPFTALFYALGLAVFGVPLLFLWPSAFKRGVARGVAAIAIGAVTAVLVVSFDFRSLPKLRFHFGNPGPVVLVLFFGAIAGFVWWWLNRGFAEPEKELSDEA